MHRTKYTPELAQYLATACDHLGYALNVRGIEEGESYLNITLNPIDRSLPDLYVDMDNDGKMVFTTLLPRDRWGHAHRSYNGDSSASQKVDPNKNGAERCAKYVDKMVSGYMEQHRHHLKTVVDIEAAYDKQMKVVEGLLAATKDIGGEARGWRDTPNHTGDLNITINFPDHYHSLTVGYGGNIKIDIGSVTPEQAAEIMRILCK